MPPAQDFTLECDVAKVDESLGLVLGYAIVCKVDGKPYVDTQGDYIPEQAMLEAATDFMLNSREARDSHGVLKSGTVPFALPLTSDIATSLGITARKTGLIIGMRPDPDLLSKFTSGEYTGFSIGGRRQQDIEIPDGEEMPGA